MKNFLLYLTVLSLALLVGLPVFNGYKAQSYLSTYLGKASYTDIDVGNFAVLEYSRKLYSSDMRFEWAAPEKLNTILPEKITFDCVAKHRWIDVQHSCQPTLSNETDQWFQLSDYLQIHAKTPWFGKRAIELELKPFSKAEGIESTGGKVVFSYAQLSKPKVVVVEGEIERLFNTQSGNQYSFDKLRLFGEVDFAKYPFPYGSLSLGADTIEGYGLSSSKDSKLTVNKPLFILSSFNLNKTLSAGVKLRADRVHQQHNKSVKTYSDFVWENNISGLKPEKMQLAMQALKLFMNDRTIARYENPTLPSVAAALLENLVYKGLRIKKTFSFSEDDETYFFNMKFSIARDPLLNSRVPTLYQFVQDIFFEFNARLPAEITTIEMNEDIPWNNFFIKEDNIIKSDVAIYKQRYILNGRRVSLDQLLRAVSRS